MPLVYPESLATFDAEAFIRRLEPLRHYEQLLASLSDIAYFAKDEQGRFVQTNPQFVSMLGVKRVEQVIGRTDLDFFPAEIAARFMADDREVMVTGEPLIQHIEPVPRPDRIFMWRGVTKVPLRDTSGRIVGVAGVSYRLHGENTNCHPGVFTAIEHIGKHYGESLTIGDLAALAGLSPRAFERNFGQTFKTPPLRYLTTVRLRAARHLLLTTSDSLAEISISCGFCDQSHMTAQFSRAFGTTPRRYRLSHAHAA